ncbi:DUF3794 domain-containing protein [Clostridium tarantellae]|uniref:DUF3794 domain-containing protein n=1 Tax=Clostridium tarantellae TaxID=39493 RepID=A0A6I1MP46_9CLOT|nr:DUF3794 domain-containing protein [Clostridium tarantellae]MPQ44248.1 DUF3794 domain-containing protein [Clostridium tarantellae]
MYCNCSNKNNYEVISLCDIKNFSHKNGPFNNKAWSQISITDILILDCKKPNIEKIEKIYVDIKITSNKIIETPVSPVPNSEGMTLTGKKLLIDGFICVKIIYTSLTKEQSVYSSNFTVPFCTYIILERNVDPFNDKYCIKTCIEDVFLSLIDCKTIFQNITLFLLAEKTSLTCANPQPPKENCTITNIPPPPPPPNTLINNIILNDLNDDAVITITFDNVDMRIVVNSTGRTTDPAGGNAYFKFTLLQSDGITEKITKSIGGNESGMDFLNNISNTNFQEGDIVNLQSQSPDKVIITNFPDSSTPRYVLSKNQISFKITQNKLNYYIPNEIIFFNNNNDIAKISFNTTNNTLTVTSTNNQFSDPKNRSMILLKLRDGNNLNTIKFHSLIPSNTNANKFVMDLNNTGFNLNDVIEITTYSPRTAKITNFSAQGQTYILDYGTTPDHTLTEFFKITSTGLQSTAPLPLPSTTQLPNIISVKLNADPNIIMFSIVFNTLDKIIFIESTTDYTPPTPGTFFNVKLLDSNGNTITEVPFDGGTRVDSYQLTTVFFKFGYILELTYSNAYKQFIEISNFPTQGNTHRPNTNEEYYKITSTGLKAHTP